MKKLIYIAFVAVAFAACSDSKSGDKKAELDKLKTEEAALRDKIMKLESELGANKKDAGNVIDVLVTNVKTQKFQHFIQVQAKVDGDENISVSPQMAGTISRVNVKVGDKVSKGTVLAQLDDQMYSKGVDELESARDFANTVYKKQKALWDQKIGTEIQYLTAKNNLESVDKKLATLREQLDMSRIKSPINGTVDAVDFKVGQAVAPGMPGLRVVNFANLKVKAEVAEAYISKVKKGDDVVVSFPDLGKTINTKVSYSGKVIDPLNRTFNVEIGMNSKDVDLHPNMVAVISIADYSSDNVVVLPLSAVQNTPEGSYVFVAQGKVARKRTIVTGRNYNGTVEVKEGLKADDPVITTGYQNLVDGQAIKY